MAEELVCAENACCKLHTAQCIACAKGMTLEEFCFKMTNQKVMQGCSLQKSEIVSISKKVPLLTQIGFIFIAALVVILIFTFSYIRIFSYDSSDEFQLTENPFHLPMKNPALNSGFHAAHVLNSGFRDPYLMVEEF